MMNIDLRKVIFMWLALLISAVLIFLISACSPEYHKQKYFKKGGQFTCDIDTLKLIDSVIVDGATVYKVRDSLVVKTNTNVVTRWQTKIKYKTVRDSIKYEVKNNRIDSRQEVKTLKVTTNYYPWWKKVLLFISGIGITSLYYFVKGLFKMPLNHFDR